MTPTSASARPRPLVRIAAAVLIVAAIAVALPFVTSSPTPTAAAADAPAVFEPLTNAEQQGPGAFGHVAVDGDGAFYDVHRMQLPLGQYIAVRKSTDNGRTWTTLQLLQGTSGGATRPQLAVSDTHVAVAFIGAYCVSFNVCHEAPYLSVSPDSGATWSGPKRLDTQAFDVLVAQDADRTWVAWERGGSMPLKMTVDGGVTWSVERQVNGALSGHLAAGDGASVFAYFTWPMGGAPGTWALVGDLDTLAATAVPVAPANGFEVNHPIGAATADGHVHVLTRESMVISSDPATSSTAVHSADDTMVFDDVNIIASGGWSASIAAVRGTVAVAVGDVKGRTWVATSHDQGTTFGAALPVVQSGNGAAPIVGIGIARPEVERPVARFSWRVPDRFVDQDGDGFPDPANDTGSQGGDEFRVAMGRTLEVTVDGCNSVAPAGESLIQYRWTQVLDDGTTQVLPLFGCSGSLELQDGERMSVRLDVVASGGRTSSTVQPVQPRDLVIASLGDSVASGEGNPHLEGALPSTTPVWQDRSCHRSVLAGPALAAEQLERDDPHTSVTFIQLACSGAGVLDSPEVAGTDDPATGGVLDRYQGQEPEPGSLRAPQLTQLADLLGLRTVDALLVSAGANDAQFATTLKQCIALPRCDLLSVRTSFEQRLATLPSRYARLAATLGSMNIEPSQVFLTEYFDPAVVDDGVISMRCIGTGEGGVFAASGFGQLDDDEARWASTGIAAGLNGAVAAAALTHGWHLVDGISQQFRGHGYCASTPWIVRIGESIATQLGVDGAFHPNQLGHAAYGTAIHRQLRSSLLVPPAAPPAGLAQGDQALGDIMVLSATNDAITVTALDDTGETPTILGSRLIDRVVSGAGGLGIVGPPAVSRTAAVGTWTQLPFLGQTDAEQMISQLAVRPNVSVLTVEVMQAPRGEHYLVTERNTTILSIIDASITEPTDVEVNWQASTVPDPDDPDAPPGRPLVAASATVTLQPGLNSVFLPAEHTFTLAEGESPQATVTAADPTGASPADDIDNERATDATKAQRTLVSRPLALEMVSILTPAGPGPNCAALAAVAQRQVAFAREVIPVAGPRFLIDMTCAAMPAIDETSEAAVEAYINLLDWLARHSQSDILVGVVPNGWLQSATGGAVGVAVAGRRGVIIEASAGKHVLAHEIAHSFGVEHVTGNPVVTGIDLTRRALARGIDYMTERTPDRAWTGPAVWDELASRIGPPGGIPDPPMPLDQAIELAGTLGNDGTLTPAPPVPGNTSSPRQPSVGANLSRMLVQQTGLGGVLSSDAVPLEEIAGQYAPDATPGGPIGLSYFTRITLLPAATSVQLVLDGTVVQQYDVAAVPEVTVTSPTAATFVGRGDTLTVSWSTAAPVGPGSLATVFASQNGGATWKPLAVNVPGNSVDVTVPLDMVDGNAVVRVVVQDGLRAGRGDSATFEVNAPVTTSPPKVAAVRQDLIDYTVPGTVPPVFPGKGIWTMNTDGTDFTEIVPMVEPVGGVGGMVPLHPDWRGDAQAIAFDGEVSGRRDLYVVNPDGSGQRRLTDEQSYVGWQFVCADWHPSGTKLVSLAADGFGGQNNLNLVEVDATTGAVTDLGWASPNFFHREWDIPCPRWSDDGNELLFNYETRDTGAAASHSDIYVLDMTNGRDSKYRFSVNSGAYESNGVYPTGMNFASGNSDRFVMSGRLFGTGYLQTVTPQDVPLFIGGDVITVPLPQLEWRGEAVTPIAQQSPFFGSVQFTPDAQTLWFTSSNDMFPTREQRSIQVNFFTFRDAIFTQSVGHFCTMPVATTDAACYVAGGDGTPVSTITDGFIIVGSPLDPVPTVGVIQADVHPGFSSLDPTPPVVVPDPAVLPGDPPEPVVDADTPTPEAPPAPGADALPPGAAPTPVARTITMTADTSTTVVLRDAGDAPAPGELTARPPANVAEVFPGAPDPSNPAATGADATVVVRPAPGFVGRFTFEVTPRGGGTPVVFTVDVVAAPTPRAVNDTITASANSRIVIQPETLLMNDVAPVLTPGAAAAAVGPSAVDQLSVRSVYGFTAGRVSFLEDGTIELLTTGTSGTFQYIVGANGASGVSTGQVTVTVTGSSNPTTSTTTPTTTAPPTTAPNYVLPETGGDSFDVLQPAAGLALVGLALVLLTRRRRPA